MADEARELSETRIARGGAVSLEHRGVEGPRFRQPNAVVKAFGDQEKRVNFATKEKCAIQFQILRRRVPPHFEIFFEAPRKFDPVARRSPILCVLTIIEMIMKLDKIALLIKHSPCLAIERGSEFGFEILRRQVVMEPARPKICHENRGRLQGLDEPAGEAQRDAVLDPGVAHAASPDGDYARLTALRLIAV